MSTEQTPIPITPEHINHDEPPFTEAAYYLRKRGLYYLPKAAGYTQSQAEAGLFGYAYALADVRATKREKDPADRVTMELARYAIKTNAPTVMPDAGSTLHNVRANAPGEILGDSVTSPEALHQLKTTVAPTVVPGAPRAYSPFGDPIEFHESMASHSVQPTSARRKGRGVRGNPINYECHARVCAMHRAGEKLTYIAAVEGISFNRVHQIAKFNGLCRQKPRAK